MTIESIVSVIEAQTGIRGTYTAAVDWQVEDDSIELPNNLSVEIGDGYIGLSRFVEMGDKFEYTDYGIFSLTRKGIQSLCGRIKEVTT